MSAGDVREAAYNFDLLTRQVCYDKHTSRSHTRIFTVYQPHIWRKRLFWSENLAVYSCLEVSFRDAV